MRGERWELRDGGGLKMRGSQVAFALRRPETGRHQEQLRAFVAAKGTDPSRECPVADAKARDLSEIRQIPREQERIVLEDDHTRPRELAGRRDLR